jgi:hypothetical protein
MTLTAEGSFGRDLFLWSNRSNAGVGCKASQFYD